MPRAIKPRSNARARRRGALDNYVERVSLFDAEIAAREGRMEDARGAVSTRNQRG